jgi:hypothetical protein
MMSPLNEWGDDWYLEEFPDVFGLIGPPAIPQLTAYLSDEQNDEFPRIIASHGLREIGKRQGSTRDEVVAALTSQLNQQEQERFTLNGALIFDLLDLSASESAEAIERAFSAGIVDEGYVGDWQSVRNELGVEGFGLPQPERPYNSVAEFRQRIVSQLPMLKGDDRRKKKKKLAAKLKQARKRKK